MFVECDVYFPDKIKIFYGENIDVREGSPYTVHIAASGTMEEMCIRDRLYTSLKIAHVNGFAHCFQRPGKLLHQLHFNVEPNGKVRILVRGVYRPANKMCIRDRLCTKVLHQPNCSRV